MIEWLIYNTIIPLLPVPLVMFSGWLKGLKSDIIPILRDGQLCFYCTAISAVALRDIIDEGIKNESVGVSIGGIIFCMILSVHGYSVAVTSENPDRRSERRIAMTSIFAAVTTTIIVANIRSSLGLL